MADKNPTPPSDSKFQHTVKAMQGTQIDPKMQAGLNKPISDDKSQLSSEDKAFLEDLMKKIEAGEINLLTPSSIINQKVYDTLDGEKKARTEIFIQASLATIRNIKSFYDSDHTNDSYMMANMLHELRLKKETLEKEIGDVLKI
jgi:hypothetical protein